MLFGLNIIEKVMNSSIDIIDKVCDLPVNSEKLVELPFDIFYRELSSITRECYRTINNKEEQDYLIQEKKYEMLKEYYKHNATEKEGNVLNKPDYYLNNKTWDKITDDVKRDIICFLWSYDNRGKIPQNDDYSSIASTLNKAIEKELKRLYYERYMDFIRSESIELSEEYKKQITGIDCRFTLGKINDISCFILDKDSNLVVINKYKSNGGKEIFIEYITRNLYNCKSIDVAKYIFKNHLEMIDLIRKLYRNPYAHTNKMTEKTLNDYVKYTLEPEGFFDRLFKDINV